jgi:hypothetical protein
LFNKPASEYELPDLVAKVERCCDIEQDTDALRRKAREGSGSCKSSSRFHVSDSSDDEDTSDCSSDSSGTDFDSPGDSHYKTHKACRNARRQKQESLSSQGDCKPQEDKRDSAETAWTMPTDVTTSGKPSASMQATSSIFVVSANAQAKLAHNHNKVMAALATLPHKQATEAPTSHNHTAGSEGVHDRACLHVAHIWLLTVICKRMVFLLTFK